VKCWGYNKFGELGNGSRVNSAVPVSVNGLSSPVTAIVTGFNHACVLVANGTMRCWGGNTTGNVGEGYVYDISGHPVEIKNIHEPIRSMVLGFSHTCVLTDSGGVKCWGSNDFGQLGNETNERSEMPVDVVGLSSGVIAISGRYNSTCALMEGGAVKCWGENTVGVLGDDTTIDRNTPVNVMGLTSGIVSISVGWEHACALTDKGGAKCWGKNFFGQLGNGTTSDSELPVDVIEPANDFLDVKAGDSITCARIKTGGVKCWGTDPFTFFDALGTYPQPVHNLPVDIVALSSGVTDLEFGEAYTCIISTDAIVRCWGVNFSGQLGDGTTINRYVPGVIVNL
jgi:alpha-tubulin suppressor-like RCC1 family protein